MLGGDAQIGINALQDIATVVRESLAVNVEKYSQQIAGKSSQVGDILRSSRLGDAPLQDQVVLVFLHGQDRLVGLNEVLESSANLHTQLRLLVKNIGQQFREGLIESLGEIKWQLTVAT